MGKTIVGGALSFVPPVAAPWAIAESEHAATHRMIIKTKAAIGMSSVLNPRWKDANSKEADPGSKTVTGNFSLTRHVLFKSEN
jgi:hypothetical protein